ERAISQKKASYHRPQETHSERSASFSQYPQWGTQNAVISRLTHYREATPACSLPRGRYRGGRHTSGSIQGIIGHRFQTHMPTKRGTATSFESGRLLEDDIDCGAQVVLVNRAVAG